MERQGKAGIGILSGLAKAGVWAPDGSKQGSECQPPLLKQLL